jgi:hypothetical protein
MFMCNARLSVDNTTQVTSTVQAACELSLTEGESIAFCSKSCRSIVRLAIGLFCLVGLIPLTALAAPQSGGDGPQSDGDGTVDESESFVSRYDRPILLYEEDHDVDGVLWVNGFVVTHGSRLFIVTESGKCQVLSEKCEIGIPTQSPNVTFVPLSDVCDIGATDSRIYNHALHVALLPVKTDVAEGIGKDLTSIALTVEMLVSNVPRRSTRVDIAGFAWGGSVYRLRLQPLALSSFVASRELSSLDLKAASSFLVSPSAEAVMSGSPVFLHHDHESTIECCGMYYSQVDFPTNQKAGIVIPASAISHMISEAVRDAR